MPFFRSIILRDWRQFREVNIQFHDRLTLLTGANGAGKTTLLSLLAQHFGWTVSFTATPNWRHGSLRWDIDFRRRRPDAKPIGSISYTNGQAAAIIVQDVGGPEYYPWLSDQQQVPGILIPSHRPVPFYQQVTSVPTIATLDGLLASYVNEVQMLRTPQRTGFSPVYRLKEALLALAMYGYDTPVLEANPEFRRAYEGFEDRLRIMLPSSLGFLGLRVRVPEVMLETRSGDFPLEAMSGGVASIIDLAWQLHMKSLAEPSFVLLIDEPENHLHPRLQRELLPSLLQAFPTVQVVAATHNPLMIGSVRDSNVWVLDFADVEDQIIPGPSQVASYGLDLQNRAGTADDVLARVLGVPASLPIWAEDALSQVLGEIEDRRRPPTRADLESLRVRLVEMGLGDAFPESLLRLAKGAE